MPSKMRWSEADRQEFAKLRKNFNAKITRLRTKNPEMADFLPPEIKISDVYSRADFNRLKKAGSMFTERGSEKKIKFHGEEVPLFFKKRMQYIQKVENARRARRREQFTPEKGTANMAIEAGNAPMRMKGRKSVYDLVKAKERLEAMFTDAKKQGKTRLYKKNYLDALDRIMGPLGAPIRELIQDLPADIFAKALERDYELSIDFVYDYIDAKIKAEALFNRWYEVCSTYNSRKYPAHMQEELFDAAYEDIEDVDFDDITERSNPINMQEGMEKPGKTSWTQMSPAEIAALFERKK